jgi:Domain of unknown function (DUF4397)
MSHGRRIRWSTWWRGLPALLLVLGAASFALPAAAQDATPAPTFPVTARFVNAMTSVETIDIDLNDDDNRIVQGLDYGKVSDPVEVTAPASNIIVKQPRNNQFDLWLFNTIVPTQAGQSYVITVSDLLVIPVQVDTTVAGADGASGRLVHAAAQAPPVDVYVKDEARPRITGLKYGSASDTGNVPPGTYDLKLNQTGTTTLVVDAPNTTFDAGQAYTFVLYGKPGSTEQPLSLLTISQAVSS